MFLCASAGCTTGSAGAEAELLEPTLNAPRVASPQAVANVPLLPAHSVQALEFQIDDQGTMHVLWSTFKKKVDGMTLAEGTYYQRGPAFGSTWSPPLLVHHRVMGARLLWLGTEMHLLLGPDRFETAALKHFVSRDEGATWEALPDLLHYRWAMIRGFDAIVEGDAILAVTLSARRFPRRDYLDFPHPKMVALDLIRWTESAGRDSTLIALFPETQMSQPAPAIRRAGDELRVVSPQYRNRFQSRNNFYGFGESYALRSNGRGDWGKPIRIAHPDSASFSSVELIAKGSMWLLFGQGPGVALLVSEDGEHWTPSLISRAFATSNIARGVSVAVNGPVGVLVNIQLASAFRYHFKLEFRTIRLGNNSAEIQTSPPTTLPGGDGQPRDVLVRTAKGRFFALWSGPATDVVPEGDSGQPQRLYFAEVTP